MSCLNHKNAPKINEWIELKCHDWSTYFVKGQMRLSKAKPKFHVMNAEGKWILSKKDWSNANKWEYVPQVSMPNCKIRLTT